MIGPGLIFVSALMGFAYRKEIKEFFTDDRDSKNHGSSRGVDRSRKPGKRGRSSSRDNLKLSGKKTQKIKEEKRMPEDSDSTGESKIEDEKSPEKQEVKEQEENKDESKDEVSTDSE